MCLRCNKAEKTVESLIVRYQREGLKEVSVALKRKDVKTAVYDQKYILAKDWL